MGKCPFGFGGDDAPRGPQLPPKDWDLPVEEDRDSAPEQEPASKCPFGFGGSSPVKASVEEAVDEADDAPQEQPSACPFSGAKASTGACPMGFGGAQSEPEDDEVDEGQTEDPGSDKKNKKPCEMINIGTTVEEMKHYASRLPHLDEEDKQNYVMMVCNAAELFPEVAKKFLEAGVVGPIGDLIVGQNSEIKFKSIRAIANILRHAANPFSHIEDTAIIKSLVVSLIDRDPRIKAVALRAIVLFLNFRGFKAALIESGVISGLSNVFSCVVPEPEEAWQIAEPERYYRSRSFSSRDTELTMLSLTCARSLCLMDDATTAKILDNGAIVRVLLATILNCDLEGLRKESLELLEVMAIAPANADALFDRGVQPHLEAIVRERASADPALAAAAVNALGSLILGQRSHDAARRGDTVELLAATVRKGPREAVLAAIDALSAFMARSAPAQKRVLAQGLVRPVVRLLGAGMEACSDLRSVPLAAEAVAPRRAKGPAGRPRSERAAEEEIASAEAEIAEEGTRREERRGLRRRRGFRVEGGRGSGEGRESSGTDDTIEHGDVARASEIAERRARREREEQEEREREREEALGAEDDLTTDDVMESEEPDTTAARRAAARFVMQACASPEGQALAVQAGAVAVLGWALRSRDFLVADACTRALDSILTGAAGLGKGDEMTRRMKDSGVILHAHAVLESNPSGPQAPALRHLIARVTPYRRDALQITFAMALIGALAVHFLTASPAALTLALCAWVALLGAFARKLEHTHFFPSLAFLAVVAALHHGALRLFPASSTVAYAAALAVASVLSLSNGSSPQTSDAVLVALTLLSGATEALAGTAWATVVHCCAAFLGESLASAYDGGLMLPCTPGARGQSFKDLPFLL